MDKDLRNRASEGCGDHSAQGSGGDQSSSSSRTLGPQKSDFSGNSFTSLPHDLHLRIFDGDLYDSPGYDVFHPFPVNSGGTSVQSQSYTESEQQRLSSTQSTESNSSTPPPPPFFTGALPPSTSAQEEYKKGPPVEIYLFKCLQHSSDGASAAWEGGIGLPGQKLVDVVVKLAFSDEEIETLIHENEVYSHLSRNRSAQLSIPTCYGVYYQYMESEDYYIGLLATSLVPGTTASRLDGTELTAAVPSIRDAVKALHAQGVTHGNIAGRNIIVHESKATLIDFGDACFTTNSKYQREDLDAVERL